MKLVSYLHRDIKYLYYSRNYKYVQVCENRKTNEMCYKAVFRKLNTNHHSGNTKMYTTEREAAIAVDIYLIKNKRDPVNVLKKR